MAYVLPQVMIQQLFSRVSTASIKDLNVFCFGPNYKLMYFDDPDTRDKIFIGRYVGTETLKDLNGENIEAELATFTEGDFAAPVYPFPEQPSDSDVDAGNVKVIFNNLKVNVAEFKDGSIEVLKDDVAGDDFDGIIRFERDVTKPDAEAGINAGIGAGDWFSVHGDNSGTPDTFKSRILEVSANGKTVRIADTLPQWILDKGDVPSSGSDPEVARTIGLYDDLYVVLLKEYDNVEIPSRAGGGLYNWAVDPDNTGVGFYESIAINLPGITGDTPVKAQVDEADVYVQYRALLKTAANGIYSLSSSTEVANALGQIHPDNPLAMGVYKAALNSADHVIYYMATTGESPEDYDFVLEKAELNDHVYFLCPMSQNMDVLQKVKAHVNEMSTKTSKQWRVAFICSPVPEQDPIYTAASDVNARDYTGHIYKVTGGRYDNKCCRFKFSRDSETKCTEDLVVGDIIRCDYSPDEYGGQKHKEFRIFKIESNDSVLIEEFNGIDKLPTEPQLQDSKCEAWHVITNVEVAEYVYAQSRQWADRRVYNVFPTVVSNAGVVMSGMYAAAAVAGLASSVLPQQPLTNVTINGFDDIPVVYQTFSKTQLNRMAEGGTFIIMQNLPNDQVYVRHQLSTATYEGNLLTQELSITKNLDSISYYFAELFRPWIGRYNITPELINQLNVELSNGITYLQNGVGAGLYGPQVLIEGTEIVYLRQSETLQDHVEALVHLNLPKPFNVFDLDLMVI